MSIIQRTLLNLEWHKYIAVLVYNNKNVAMFTVWLRQRDLFEVACLRDRSAAIQSSSRSNRTIFILDKEAKLNTGCWLVHPSQAFVLLFYVCDLMTDIRIFTEILIIFWKMYDSQWEQYIQNYYWLVLQSDLDSGRKKKTTRTDDQLTAPSAVFSWAAKHCIIWVKRGYLAKD